MKATIHYYDIGDYLSQQEKLKIIKNFKSISNLPFVELQPNKEGDWINERNESFDSFIPLVPDKKFNVKSQTFFVLNSLGINSNRDAWVYNSSLKSVLSKMKDMVEFYNMQVLDFKKEKVIKPNLKVEDFKETDPKKISWSSSLVPNLERGNYALYENEKVTTSLYRPYFKQHLYYGDKVIHRRGQMNELFPIKEINNLVIYVTGLGGNKDFSVLISDKIMDLNCLEAGAQGFPIYYYEERQTQSLFDKAESGTSEFVRRDAISDFILDQAKERYSLAPSPSGRAGVGLTKEDIFYYVYGLLHSPTYRELFANDLKKMLPRLPLLEDVRDFWKFSKTGRQLAELHINYENQPTPAGVIVIHNPLTITETLKQLSADEIKYIDYKVEKMRFAKGASNSSPSGRLGGAKETIHYNNRITIDNIPAKAYKYVVNGKPAIEWIMERYAITTHKESQITNNPNDWAEEVGNPKYILDLLLSVINVSLQTVDIVENLPTVKF